MLVSPTVDTNNTHLIGYIYVRYKDLVKAFGKPNKDPHDKSTCEWSIQFDDLSVATIYDWKECYTHKGYYWWHIGGHNNDALESVLDYIENSEYVVHGWKWINPVENQAFVSDSA